MTRRLNRQPTADAAREIEDGPWRDDAFARELLARGLITPERLEVARADQAGRAAAGVRLRLGQVLLKRGWLDAAQHLEIECALGQRMHVCPECRDPQLVDPTPESTQVLCRHCGEPLVPLIQVQQVPGVTLELDIGRYHLRRVIARGGMGVVFEAEDRELGRRVAVKLLHEEGQTPTRVARLWREAQLAARLTHPNIVTIHETGRTPSGRPYLVMAYVEGQPLGEAVADADLDERMRLFEQVVAAAGHAHGEGVIHRDLKPDNALVCDDGHVVVVDFGLAREHGAGGLTHSGEALGTPHYMAPEQVDGAPDRIASHTDVWALGVMLYELLTDRLPFDGTTAAAVFAKIREHEPQPPRALCRVVPRDLETICLKALMKDPERRYASGWALLEDLRRWRLGEPVSARRPSRLYRLRRRIRRHPGAAAGMAVATLLLLAGAVMAVLLVRSRAELRASRTLHEALDRSTAALVEWETQRYGVPHDVTPWRDALARTVEPLEAALRLDPGSALAWRQLGRARIALGDMAGALDALGRSLDLDPTDGEAWYWQGRALMRSGLRLQAQLLGATSPDRRQRLLAERDRVRAGTRVAFETAAGRIDPNGPDAMRRDLARGYLLWHAGKPDLARDLLREIASRHTLGGEQALMLLGRLTPGLAEKVDLFDEVVERARADADARAAASYARTFLADQMAERAGERRGIEARYRTAVQQASRAIAIDPSSLNAWVARGTARVSWGYYLGHHSADPTPLQLEAVRTDFARADQLHRRQAHSCLASGETADQLARRLEAGERVDPAQFWFAMSDACLTRAIGLIGLHRSAARAWSGRARRELAAGRPLDALGDLQKAVQLDRSLGEALRPLIERGRAQAADARTGPRLEPARRPSR